MQMKAGKKRICSTGRNVLFLVWLVNLSSVSKGSIEPLPLCDEVTRGSERDKRGFIVVALHIKVAASQPKGLQSFD